jgi:signal transduction histidine kinase
MIDKGQPTCQAAGTDDLFRLVLAELPAIIWSTDSELRFTCSLGAGLSALNLEHGQVVGRTLCEFLQTDDRSLPAIAAHYRALGGKSVSFEQEWAGCTYQTRVDSLRDEGGQIVGCIGVAHDISRQKEAERQLGEAHQDLERRVVERTAELAESNRELEHELVQRRKAEEAVKEERQHLRRSLEQYDRDRQLVAYEIHDGLAQDLAAAIMHLQTYQLEKQNGKEADRFLDEGIEELVKSMEETRGLISALRSPAFEEMGFIAAIEELLGQASNDTDDLEMELVHSGDFSRLTAPMANALYRITQESLTNAKRYSQSERVRVQLTEQGDRVRVEVQDRGVGFDPEAAQDDCFGLEGIRERARLFGGSATIDSKPGKGTLVKVELPLGDDMAEEPTEFSLSGK